VDRESLPREAFDHHGPPLHTDSRKEGRKEGAWMTLGVFSAIIVAWVLGGMKKKKGLGEGGRIGTRGRGGKKTVDSWQN